MKRLLGLLLVLGMVGCGGGDNAPQQTDGSIAAAPSDVPKPDVPKPSVKVLHTLKGHTDAVRSAAFSPYGQRIVSGSHDNTLKIWDASSGKELQTLKGHDGNVNHVAFSPDGQRIVSGSGDETLRIWDASE